jgi:hypothetical protein
MTPEPTCAMVSTVDTNNRQGVHMTHTLTIQLRIRIRSGTAKADAGSDRSK